MKVLKIYKYGSQVYLYKNPSDLDFIHVVDETPSGQIESFTEGNKEFHLYPLNIFKEKLAEHEISALECIFQEQDNFFNFELNKEKLRSSISKQSSNSYVKAKKKLIIEKDYSLITAQKSIFHSLRILHFGIQIAKYNKIIDWKEANSYWLIIQNLNNWEELNNHFKPIYNNLKSEFKKVCPK